MGEAKKRKQNDKFYGRLPKNGYGLIISAPINIDKGAIQASSDLDKGLLRSQLLFWDRLVWPTNRLIHLAGGNDEEFLISCGIISRPDYTVSNTSDDIFQRGHVKAFDDLNEKEPGQWAMSLGEGSLNVIDDAIVSNRGTLIQLIKAIPVPDKDVPLNDVLEFKEKRRDEMLSLRIALDNIYNRIINSKDSEHALNSALNEIQLCCADAVRVAKETGLPFKLSSWDLNISLDPISLAGGAIAAASSLYNGLPFNTALLNGASISLATSFRLKKETSTSQPFRYVTSIHKEFI